MSQLLITTADERTWANDGPVVFLGKWCLRPAREQAWRRLEGIVAEPFYPDLKRRLELSDEARSIRDELMDTLPARLDEYHGVAYGKRYWQILVGPFLARYVRVIINRYLTLEQCLNHYPCDRTIALKTDFCVVPNDTLHFLNLVDNDVWDSQLCSWLIADFFPNVRIQTVEVENESRSALTNNIAAIERSTVVGKLRHAATAMVEYVNSKASYYIHDMHASRPLKLGFGLLNGQIPISRPYAYSFPGRPLSDRTGLSCDGLLKVKTALYHHAIERYLNKLMPRVFVEEYSDLVHATRQPHLPRSPKVIITSVAFDTHETFKAWVAEKVCSGTKYIVLQHGAVYGVNPFFANTVEELTSDAFITWGWQKRTNDLAGFCLTTPGRSLPKHQREGRLLLVEMILRRRKFIWDVYAEFDRYQNNQFEFLKNLSLKVRNKTTVRLHAAHTRSYGGEQATIKHAFPDIEIDAGQESIWKNLYQYRILIFSYDSTGILELLNSNFPVLGFWDRLSFDQFDEEARPYFERLVDAGIIHFDPTSIAKFIDTIWDSVDDWWNSSAVMHARKLFCQRYAAQNDRPVTTMKSLIELACADQHDK